MSFLTNNARLLMALALFACVCFGNVILAAVFALALSMRWRAYEVIACGILYDLLWSIPPEMTLNIHMVPFASLTGLVLVFGLAPLRRTLL